MSLSQEAARKVFESTLGEIYEPKPPDEKHKGTPPFQLCLEASVHNSCFDNIQKP